MAEDAPKKKAAPRKRRPPLTAKEKAWVKEFLETRNATEAAARTYDVSSRESANTIGARNHTHLIFDGLFQKAGLTDAAIVKNTVRMALEAKKIVGTRDDFVEVEDNEAQLKAMKFAVDLMDKMPAKKADTTLRNPDGSGVFEKVRFTISDEG